MQTTYELQMQMKSLTTGTPVYYHIIFICHPTIAGDSTNTQLQVVYLLVLCVTKYCVCDNNPRYAVHSSCDLA